MKRFTFFGAVIEARVTVRAPEKRLMCESMVHNEPLHILGRRD